MWPFTAQHAAFSQALTEVGAVYTNAVQALAGVARAR
jgi:hypothetical protein